MDTDNLISASLRDCCSVGLWKVSGKKIVFTLNCVCCFFSPSLYCIYRGKPGQVFVLPPHHPNCLKSQIRPGSEQLSGHELSQSGPVCMPTPRDHLPSLLWDTSEAFSVSFLVVFPTLICLCFIFSLSSSTMFTNCSRSQTDGLISLAKMKFKNHLKVNGKLRCFS